MITKNNTTRVWRYQSCNENP